MLTATPAFSQVTIDDTRTEPVRTSTAGTGGTPDDVIIGTGGGVALDTEGPALILDSDNTLGHQGTISITDVDNATGVLLEGGANRGYTQTGVIQITEDFPEADTDDDPFVDTPFASGTGRTGILVSGASPFEGNITLDEAANIIIEGNNSYAINLANTPIGAGLDGDLTVDGQIALTGDNGAGVRIGSDVTGNVSNSGRMEILGRGSSAFDIGADIGGGFSTSGIISNTGFRFPTRPNFNPDALADRLDLDAEDLGDAGSVIRVSGNIARGINLTNEITVTQDADGNDVETVTALSQINHFGSAPAIILDGDGTPIMIGTISPITDPTDPDYDEDLLYAFRNIGTLTSSGVYDEFDSTVFSVSDATLEGGITNSGTMQSQSFVGGVFRDIDGVDLGTGLSRVIVLGDNAIAERLNNTGLIIARVNEAVDEVYFDRDNIPAPRQVEAIAIDIGATASMETLINEGSINAVLLGRQGLAVVVRDASGTLSTITNRGFISASGTNSDSTGLTQSDFTLIAFDLSNNTSGVDILQELAADNDPDDGLSPVAPQIFGDILLGSGDDTLISTAGFIAGDIDFGAGNDVLSLDDTAFSGGLTNQDGLDITVANGSLLSIRSNAPVDITSATFDGTSTFSPLVDGAAGTASTLQATGAISFASGALINPILTNLINDDTINNTNATSFEIATGSSVSVADLDTLNASDDGSFLFDTAFDLINDDTLVVTVDLRDAGALGLDATQIGVAETVFGATLQALQNNNVLGNEIANIASAGDFYAAYNQLLPEFAAAGRQFVIANSDGAVGAVANHLDAARRSQEKPGGAWIQEFAYFADRDLAGLSEQYRGEGFGFSAGLDTALGPFHAVGVNFGFASTEVEDVVGIDEPLDMTTVLAGLYAGYARGNLGVDAYLGGGYNQFDQNRRVEIGSYSGESSGSWDGYHMTASLRVGYDIDIGERFWARPVASLDYLRLSESGYTETGPTGIALIVDDRTSELGAFSALMNFGAEFNGQRTWIRPSIRFGYRNEFLSDPVLTSYRFAGINNATLATTESAAFPSSGLLVGFSVAAGSGFSSVGFDFDSDIRDGFVRHTGRIVIRLLF